MVKRNRIALIYSYDSNWVAGAYYICNLVHALNLLPEDEKPVVVILGFDIKDFINLRETTLYPFLEFHKLSFKHSYSSRVINYFSRKIWGKNFFERRLSGKEFDLVYPANNNYYVQLLENLVDWIPDFQEDYYPDFFSEENILDRKKRQSYLADNEGKIVFSSNNAKADFIRLYPTYKAKLYVLPFASTHSLNNSISIKKILTKYDLKEGYVLCSNQFWRHKNHQVVLRALKLLKEKDDDTRVVFTGKPFDSRAEGYYEELKSYAELQGLENAAIFLDFIPREDQLLLMKHARLIVQPSLFEGWGTTIEDAKNFNNFILASNISVHREQLINYPNCAFFEGDDFEHLAELMSEKEYEIVPYNYGNDILCFAKKFQDLYKS